MAEMPRGKPRFGFGVAQPQQGRPTPLPPFEPFGRLDAVRQSARLSPTVRIGDQTFREIDNGRAGVLVPTSDSRFSPAELVAQREGIERALFQTGYPLSTIASGVAGTLGAPQRVQDAILRGGALIEDVVQGAAPRARTVRSRSPSAQSLGPPLKRDRIWYGGDDMDRPATYVGGTAVEGLLGGGTKPDRNIEPPGWRGNGRVFNEARGHLAAAQLGGSGDDPRNLVTLTQNKTNSSHMKRFENSIARKARNGEVVEYLTMPLYSPGSLAPSAILMTAYGSTSGPSARYIHNPAGRQR